MMCPTPLPPTLNTTYSFFFSPCLPTRGCVFFIYFCGYLGFLLFLPSLLPTLNINPSIFSTFLPIYSSFPAFQPSLFIHLSHPPTLNTNQPPFLFLLFLPIRHLRLCGFFPFFPVSAGFHWCLYSLFSNFRGVGPNALGWRMNKSKSSDI